MLSPLSIPDSIPMYSRNGSTPNISISNSTIDCDTPSVKNLQATASDQNSSIYKKPHSLSTTASSSPSFCMKYKCETSLEMEENGVFVQPNEGHAVMGNRASETTTISQRLFIWLTFTSNISIEPSSSHLIT